MFTGDDALGLQLGRHRASCGALGNNNLHGTRAGPWIIRDGKSAEHGLDALHGEVHDRPKEDNNDQKGKTAPALAHSLRDSGAAARRQRGRPGFRRFRYSFLVVEEFSGGFVPGLGFDLDGDRLGHGRGYYDRALADLDLDTVIAILMDQQWLPSVPTGEHDVGLRWLCSPSTGLVRAR